MNRLIFPDRDAWLAARQVRVGGSEVAALFDCQAAYQLSKFALWQVKARKIPAPDVSGQRPEWGLRLERAIADGAAEKHGWTIEAGGYVDHDKVPGMGCSLDFVITNAGDDKPRPPGALEIKNVDWLQHKRQWGDEPPIHIQLQLQHQLACTGFEWGAVVALVGGNDLAEPYYFERRPKIIAEIEKRVCAFWRSIEAGQEPPVDSSDSTGAALAALFPESAPGKDIDLSGDNEFPEQWATLKQAQLNRKAGEAAERAAKNWLMAKVGDAELIKYAGQIVATLKTQHRKAYQVEASSSRVLRIKEN